MKMYLLSDNSDTLLGMRFAGVEGSALHTKDDVMAKVAELAADKSYAVILITSKLMELCGDQLSDFMERNPMPLILEIPDRHGAGRERGSILDFIEHSIGLKLGKQPGSKESRKEEKPNIDS